MNAHDTSDALPVARVYAQALWNLAQKEGQSEVVLEEYNDFVNHVLDQNPVIERFLSTVTIGKDARQTALTKAVAGKVSDLVYNFFLTLNRHDRLGLIRLCGLALQEIADNARGMQSVEVRSAVALSEQQKEDLTQVVRRRFNIEPRLDVKIDPSLLGGLWLRVGDTVLDRTLKTNLRKLRDVIRTRNTHEIQSGRSYFDSSS
jgi:F-type H+-transporting ATPase subunit delta